MYPCCYSKQEQDFKKEEVKPRAWNEIAKELGENRAANNPKQFLSKRPEKLKELDVFGDTAGPVNKT